MSERAAPVDHPAGFYRDWLIHLSPMAQRYILHRLTIGVVLSLVGLEITNWRAYRPTLMARISRL